MVALAESSVIKPKIALVANINDADFKKGDNTMLVFAMVSSCPK